MLYENRLAGNIPLPVALGVKVAAYPTIYSIQLYGIQPGSIVHLTGQVVATNDLPYNVGLGVVLLSGDTMQKEVVPYSMRNVTPEIHHDSRPFSAYDIPDSANPLYALKVYAVSTKAVDGDILTVHGPNGFMQAAIHSPSQAPQLVTIFQPDNREVDDLRSQITVLQTTAEGLSRVTAQLNSPNELTLDSLDTVADLDTLAAPFEPGCEP